MRTMLRIVAASGDDRNRGVRCKSCNSFAVPLAIMSARTDGRTLSTEKRKACAATAAIKWSERIWPAAYSAPIALPHRPTSPSSDQSADQLVRSPVVRVITKTARARLTPRQKPSICAAFGPMAEWLRRGLQILAPEFDSRSGLHSLEITLLFPRLRVNPMVAPIGGRT